MNSAEFNEFVYDIEAIAEDNGLDISVEKTGYCYGDYEVFIADKEMDENYSSSIFFFGDIDGLAEDVAEVVFQFLDYLRNKAATPDLIQRVENFIDEFIEEMNI